MMSSLRRTSVQQLRTIFFEEFETAFDCFHYTARCNGGSGKLIEHAAVFFYAPFIRRWIAQIFSLEGKYPTTLRRFDLVAQARRFPVLDHAHTGDFSIAINAHDAINSARVAIAANLVYQRFHLPRFARA